MTLAGSGGSVLGGIRDKFLWASGTKFSGTEVHIILLEKTLSVCSDKLLAL
jgi:hypothetical protein